MSTNELCRIAWHMEPDHQFEFVVGRVGSRRSIERELAKAKPGDGHIVPADTVSKRRR
jgi:hypothetical protein